MHVTGSTCRPHMSSTFGTTHHIVTSRFSPNIVIAVRGLAKNATIPSASTGMVGRRRTQAMRRSSFQTRQNRPQPRIRLHVSHPWIPVSPPQQQRHHRQQPTTAHPSQMLALAQGGRASSSSQNPRVPPRRQRSAPSSHFQEHTSSPRS